MIKREELTNPNSCMNRAHDDEMTFVLLARDAAAPMAIRAWIHERVRLGKNKLGDEQIVSAYAVIREMESAAAPASPAGSEESICPRCMGTGEYGATLGGARPCAICHGTGKITPDIANEPPAGSGANVFAEVVPGRKATNWVEAQPPAAVPSDK